MFSNSCNHPAGEDRESKMEDGNSLFHPRICRALWAVACCALPLAICHLTGCASSPPSTQPTSIGDRQDAAINDPMDYKPDFPKDVSGGDIGHYDKDGMNRDLNDFLNP
jgi:hypothetical protein